MDDHLKKVIRLKTRLKSLLTLFEIEEIAMKKFWLTKEQVKYALRQAEGGAAVKDDSRRLGVSQPAKLQQKAI